MKRFALWLRQLVNYGTCYTLPSYSYLLYSVWYSGQLTPLAGFLGSSSGGSAAGVHRREAWIEGRREGMVTVCSGWFHSDYLAADSGVYSCAQQTVPSRLIRMVAGWLRLGY